MTQIGRHFSLAADPGGGVFCEPNGVFVGLVPLLDRFRDSNGVYKMAAALRVRSQSRSQHALRGPY
jgi:hypothetical protein